MNPRMGRLEPVDLRTVWKNEAADFTPWLAQQANLALLGETIGLDLQLESREKPVGPYRADLLCRDTLTDSWVLIENQIEQTDHSHLGQIMTYAAGLDAVTIIWIARRFTDEHRAALDWLNEITGEGINFFGLEVELWKIGDSPYAPKFNVVCQPNEWLRRTKAEREGEISDLQQLQLEYWEALAAHLVEQQSIVPPPKPRPSYEVNFPSGRSSIRLRAFVNTRDKRIGVILSCSGPDAKAFYHLLEAQRESIEQAFGTALEWSEAGAAIRLRWHDCDPTERARWPEQHRWLQSVLEGFYTVLKPRYVALDPGDYYAQQDAAGENGAG